MERWREAKGPANGVVSKHWYESKGYSGTSDERYKSYRHLVLLDEHGVEARIVSLTFGEGRLIFIEECDANFAVEMTPDDAIAALQEAIDWIKEKSQR